MRPRGPPKPRGSKEPDEGRKRKKDEEKKLAMFLTDFDKQCKVKYSEIERAGNSLMKQVQGYYAQEICKIAKTTREIKLKDFLTGKDRSVTATLQQIEEEIGNAIQLPNVKKPRTLTKTMPPPAKPSTRRKRQDIKEEDETKAENETPAVASVAVAPTPFLQAKNIATSTPTVVDQTFDVDKATPENLVTPGPFNVTRTIKKPDGVENNPVSTAKAPPKKPFVPGTVCRKPLPNELLWSSSGSPVVVDPRVAAAQSNVQAAISLSKATLALTDSPAIDEKDDKIPRLNISDLKEVEKLQQKLSKIVAFNKRNINATTDDLEPTCSKY